MEKIEQKNLADVAEERICQYIRDEGIAVGEPLLGELEFAERLGVSRNIVREALSRLRMIGLVESRKRRGMVRGKADIFRGLGRVLDAAALDEEEILSLMELRLVMEMGMADVVHARKTEDNLQRLEDVVRQEEKAKSRAEKIAVDYAFHEILFEMTGNPLLQQFHRILAPFFRKTHELMPQVGEGKGAVITHRELLEKLRLDNPEPFREILHSHLSVRIYAIKYSTHGKENGEDNV